jgi:hypothetical protein
MCGLRGSVDPKPALLGAGELEFILLLARSDRVARSQYSLAPWSERRFVRRLLARRHQTQHEPDPGAERHPKRGRNRDGDKDAAKQIGTVVGDDPNSLMVDHRLPCGRVCLLTAHVAPSCRLENSSDGGCTCREGYTIGVLFLAKTTNREAFGRLRGVPPEEFDRVTTDQLREALIAALSGHDD